MNQIRDPESVLAAWVDEGPTTLPDTVRRAISVDIRSIRQERRALRVPWRLHPMSNAMKLAAAAAAVAISVAGGALLLGGRSDRPNVGGPSPSEAPSTTPGDSPAASPTTDPLDTTGWTPYESARYGFTIAYPADWTEVPAERDWTFEADADNWLSPAMESFHSSVGSGVRVSAWKAPMDPGSTIEAFADLEPWVTAYCEATKNGPCTGIHERAVPLCVEVRDCHPGLLVPFRDDVQAFFTAGTAGSDMTVVAVWWAEDAPATEMYGGSQQLLEAFLSTMNVWPEDDRPY